MSLLKAYHIELDPARTLELIKADFTSSLEGVMTEIDKKQFVHETHEDALLAGMIALYAEYSVAYLHAVATTLEEPKNASDSMKFMNSYIVSFLHELELHYYDKEQGYSVIDKAVQAALDNEGTVSVKEISNIVEEIEASYVEEDVEDVEDADMTSESWDD